MTEQELRAYEVPWPKTVAELNSIIEALASRNHDYGTCVYAVSISAQAAFNYMATVLGITGFQASCADLDVIRRVRMLKGPFAIFKLEDGLFPQYDLQKNFNDWLHSEENRKWLRENAQKRLDEYDAQKAKDPNAPSMIHPRVLGHWVRLAEQK